MERSLKLDVDITEIGELYLKVYQVFGVDFEGENVLKGSFANKNEAEDYCDCIKKTLSSFFVNVYVSPIIVWL